MTIGGLSQTIKARDLGLGVGDSGPWETRLSMARANESPAARCPVSAPRRRATGPSCSSRLRSEEHTSELQSQSNLVCRLLLEKKKNTLCYVSTCVHDRHLSERH